MSAEQDDVSPKKRPRGRPKNGERLLDTLEQLDLFRSWQSDVLPRLAIAMKAAKTPEDIYKAFATDAACRAVMIATTSRDAGKAMAAITEILNRSQGRPTEQIQLEHKYSKLKDEELDALVLSVVGSKRDKG